jgi:hypothetical protein
VSKEKFLNECRREIFFEVGIYRMDNIYKQGEIT